MNDELKGVLEWLKTCGNNDYIFETGHSRILLNYITNLQQKIKHYEETTTFGDYVKEVNLLVDYKSRIEKAVEILKRYTDNESNYYVPVFKLIDILNGRSDE